MGFFRNLFARNNVERELEDEVGAYLDLLIAERIKAGMTPEDARRSAIAAAGTADSIKADVRTARRGAWLANTWDDFVFGARILRRAPGFAAITILTIALGIGANSAIFSVINAVVRKPLPYPHSNELMYVTSQFTTLNFEKFWLSPPEYFDYKQHSRVFADLAAYTTGAMNITNGDRPERVSAAFVTANMFSVLGVAPARGQTFTPAQDLPNAERVVVMAYELWQRMFGGDPGIVGKRIDIQGAPRTVVGVMPPGFDLHDNRTQLWVPLGLDPANPGGRGSHFLYAVGRVAPGRTETQANAELEGMLKSWRELAPDGHVPNDSTHRVQMTPLRVEVVGNVGRALWVLQGAVALVLLIACANVANLLLARAESRHKEFAVRTALGAGRVRILRQFIAEGLVVSVGGAAVGLGIAYWGLKALLAANPTSIPRAAEVTLDPTVLLFTIGVAIATGLIFGLAPLLHVGEKAVSLAMKEGGARTTGTAARQRVRGALVAAEIALAVMLVTGAGLLLRTFDNLTNVDLGFDAANRVTFSAVLPAATYQEPDRVTRFFTDLTERLEGIPGVERAAVMQGLPPFRPVNANDADFEGRVTKPGDPPANIDYYQAVTASYFQTMGISLTRGRGFEPGDVTGPPVAIINEALAKRFYPGEDPVGRRVNPFLAPDTTLHTIVGVVEDVKQGGLDTPPGTEIYFSYEQFARVAGFPVRQMNVVVESELPLGALAPNVRGIMNKLDPTIPIVRLRTMDDVIDDAASRQKLLSLLLGIFAIVALTLAAVGTYGILAYMVAERRREIGIRRALGAQSGHVARLVVTQGLTMALIGVAIGVAGALAASRLTATLLYGVSPSDPLTFGTVVGVILLVAAIACLVPLRRAMRVDPLAAMRAEWS